jgi:hypothetical protein
LGLHSWSTQVLLGVLVFPESHVSSRAPEDPGTRHLTPSCHRNSQAFVVLGVDCEPRLCPKRVCLLHLHPAQLADRCRPFCAPSGDMIGCRSGDLQKARKHDTHLADRATLEGDDRRTTCHPGEQGNRGHPLNQYAGSCIHRTPIPYRLKCAPMGVATPPAGTESSAELFPHLT